MMLGPHDKDSTNSGVMSNWGIKTKSNDQVRQEYLNEHVPELLELGLTLPDPDLHQDEDGNWIHGPINWDEFWSVVKGQTRTEQGDGWRPATPRTTTAPGCARRCWPTGKGSGRRRQTNERRGRSRGPSP